jgi:hypothetical protein
MTNMMYNNNEGEEKDGEDDAKLNSNEGLE